jgi:hypothetical protein
MALGEPERFAGELHLEPAPRHIPARDDELDESVAAAGLAAAGGTV